MTNVEAIKILQGAIKQPNKHDGYLGEAIAVACKALAEQQKTDFLLTIMLKAGCETCKHLLEEECDCEFEFTGYEPKDEPTISKMEQVDKDINVRSKEPQGRSE